MAQANTNKTIAAPASSAVTLTFTPNNECDCTQIAFVQTVRVTDTKTGAAPVGMSRAFDNEPPRRTPKRWNVDRISGRMYGWYGRNNDGTFAGTVTTGSANLGVAAGVNATLYDAPTSWKSTNERWEFETCAICLAGNQANRVYGCRTWGFTTDKDGVVTSSAGASSATPSVDWKSAVSMWNTQQAQGGPIRAKQSPNMVEFPTFTYG